MNIKTTTLLAGLCLLGAAPDGHACGEMMYRMGGALRYHAFITRHPAQILLYTGAGAPTYTDAERARFHAELERAGHHVTEARDPDALAQAFARQRFDVVITSTADLDVVGARAAQAQGQPTLLPVVRHGDGDPRQWRERYPRLLAESANLNQFLKAIEQSMTARGS